MSPGARNRAAATERTYNLRLRPGYCQRGLYAGLQDGAGSWLLWRQDRRETQYGDGTLWKLHVQADGSAEAEVGAGEQLDRLYCSLNIASFYNDIFN